ncbi:hypothetical protein GQ600_24186 [Phytophthora cactorum]|nr:hypothetical protein GQ600_24186 [Phytophthora cactorum]
MVALGGSANMTKAARSRNDEFIFHVEGPAAYQAQALFNSLLEKTLKLGACHDTADTMAIDDENTADITQALVQPS